MPRALGVATNSGTDRAGTRARISCSWQVTAADNDGESTVGDVPVNSTAKAAVRRAVAPADSPRPDLRVGMNNSGLLRITCADRSDQARND